MNSDQESNLNDEDNSEDMIESSEVLFVGTGLNSSNETSEEEVELQENDSLLEIQESIKEKPPSIDNLLEQDLLSQSLTLEESPLIEIDQDVKLEAQVHQVSPMITKNIVTQIEEFSYFPNIDNNIDIFQNEDLIDIAREEKVEAQVHQISPLITNNTATQIEESSYLQNIEKNIDVQQFDHFKEKRSDVVNVSALLKDGNQRKLFIEDINVEICDPQKRQSKNFTFYYTYTIKVFKSGKMLSSISRRYQDFEWLNKSINYHIPGLFLPKLPPKNFMVKINMIDESFMKQRLDSLNQYVQILLSKKQILNSVIFFEFMFETPQNFGLYMKNESLDRVEIEDQNLVSKISEFFSDLLSDLNQQICIVDEGQEKLFQSNLLETVTINQTFSKLKKVSQKLFQINNKIFKCQDSLYFSWKQIDNLGNKVHGSNKRLISNEDDKNTDIDSTHITNHFEDEDIDGFQQLQVDKDYCTGNQFSSLMNNNDNDDEDLLSNLNSADQEIAISLKKRNIEQSSSIIEDFYAEKEYQQYLESRYQLLEKKIDQVKFQIANREKYIQYMISVRKHKLQRGVSENLRDEGVLGHQLECLENRLKNFYNNFNNEFILFRKTYKRMLKEILLLMTRISTQSKFTNPSMR